MNGQAVGAQSSSAAMGVDSRESCAPLCFCCRALFFHSKPGSGRVGFCSVRDGSPGIQSLETSTSSPWISAPIPLAIENHREVDPQILAKAKAIDTDSADVIMPPGWTLVPVVDFHRSSLIELKQRDIALYRIERPPNL